MLAATRRGIHPYSLRPRFPREPPARGSLACGPAGVQPRWWVVALRGAGFPVEGVAPVAVSRLAGRSGRATLSSGRGLSEAAGSRRHFGTFQLHDGARGWKIGAAGACVRRVPSRGRVRRPLGTQHEPASRRGPIDFGARLPSGSSASTSVTDHAPHLGRPPCRPRPQEARQRPVPHPRSTPRWRRRAHARAHPGPGLVIPHESSAANPCSPRAFSTHGRSSRRSSRWKPRR